MRAPSDLTALYLVADACVGAFFAAPSARAAEAERARRLGLVERWLDHDDEAALRELAGLVIELREAQVPFHWPLEYLDQTGADVGTSSFATAFIGNPPFMGGNSISRTGGRRYIPWLQAVHPGAHGNADLSAHFLRRAAALLGDCGGGIGLITTNTINQGDTKQTGVDVLRRDGLAVHVSEGFPWPGGAAVHVVVVHAFA